MSLRALIVDDEPLAQRRLRLALEEIADVEVVGVAADGDEAVCEIERLLPELVFLDVQMPGRNGVAIARALRSRPSVQVIFVSAFAEFAPVAFELDAVDYLLKPIRFDRVRSAVERARRRLDLARTAVRLDELERQIEEGRQGYDSEIWVSQRDGHMRVAVDAILRIEAAKDYALIHTASRTHIQRTTMAALERRLDPGKIMRVHRSSFIRLSSVRQVQWSGRNLLRLHAEDGAIVEVGASYSRSVVLALGLETASSASRA